LRNLCGKNRRFSTWNQGKADLACYKQKAVTGKVGKAQAKHETAPEPPPDSTKKEQKKGAVQLTPEVVEQLLASPDAVQLIAKEVSGKIVPDIVRELRSNPGPGADSTVATLSEQEVATKVFEQLEAGGSAARSFIDVSLSWTMITC